LTINYKTDLFPSHGIIVFKNNAETSVQILKDASDVKATGAIGAVNIAAGLSSQSNKGKFRMP
jgi:hypothetical protein